MRVKLSKLYWIKLYLASFVYFIGMIYFYFKVSEALGDSMILMCYFILFYIMLCVSYAFSRRRYLITLKIDEKMYSAALFGRVKCRVFTERDIYYVLFKCRESNIHMQNYIAISNEYFAYEGQKTGFNWPRRTFIDSHDASRIIILPYNEKTKHLCPIEKWTNVKLLKDNNL